MGGVFDKIGDLLREKIEGESEELERGRVETVREEPAEEELGEPAEEDGLEFILEKQSEPCVGEVVHLGEYCEDVPVKIVTDEISK